MSEFSNFQLLLSLIANFILWAISTAGAVIISIFSFRYVLSIIGPFMKEDFGSILKAEDSFWNQKRMNVVFTFHVDGKLNVEFMRKFFMERVILLKNGNGRLKNPELQQYLYSWFGFYFWKWDKDFKIENHIRVYDTSRYESHDDLVKYLESTPFPSGKSPWNIYLLSRRPKTNYSDDEKIISTVVFHLHHSQFDGISLLMLLFNTMIGQPLPKSDEIKFPRVGIIKLFRFLITRFVHLLLTNRIEFFDTNEWNLRKFNPHYEPDFRVSTSGNIPLKLIKNVQLKYKVCTTTVIYFGITAALRKIMIKKSMKLPKRIRVWTPYLRPLHPDKFENHFDLAEINLPVGISDATERLQFIKNDVIQSKEGVFQLALQLGIKFVGCLPNFLRLILCRNYYATMTLSRVKSTYPLTLFGKNVLRYTSVAGIPSGNNPITIYLLGYREYLHFTIQMHSYLVTQEELNEIYFYVIQELEMAMNTDLCQ